MLCVAVFSPSSRQRRRSATGDCAAQAVARHTFRRRRARPDRPIGGKLDPQFHQVFLHVHTAGDGGVEPREAGTVAFQEAGRSGTVHLGLQGRDGRRHGFGAVAGAAEAHGIAAAQAFGNVAAFGREGAERRLERRAHGRHQLGGERGIGHAQQDDDRVPEPPAGAHDRGRVRRARQPAGPLAPGFPHPQVRRPQAHPRAGIQTVDLGRIERAVEQARPALLQQRGAGIDGVRRIGKEQEQRPRGEDEQRAGHAHGAAQRNLEHPLETGDQRLGMGGIGQHHHHHRHRRQLEARPVGGEQRRRQRADGEEQDGQVLRGAGDHGEADADDAAGNGAEAPVGRHRHARAEGGLHHQNGREHRPVALRQIEPPGDAIGQQRRHRGPDREADMGEIDARKAGEKPPQHALGTGRRGRRRLRRHGRIAHRSERGGPGRVVPRDRQGEAGALLAYDAPQAMSRGTGKHAATDLSGGDGRGVDLPRG